MFIEDWFLQEIPDESTTVTLQTKEGDSDSEGAEDELKSTRSLQARVAETLFPEGVTSAKYYVLVDPSEGIETGGGSKSCRRKGKPQLPKKGN